MTALKDMTAKQIADMNRYQALLNLRAEMNQRKAHSLSDDELDSLSRAVFDEIAMRFENRERDIRAHIEDHQLSDLVLDRIPENQFEGQIRYMAEELDTMQFDT
jgi:predicted Zn-dependent protease with MMP-like domain